MSILNRANEQAETIWRPVPEGLWRWIVGRPELKPPDKFPNYQVRFLLTLTGPEQSRLIAENEAPPKDTQQSTRVSYTTGLSLGYMKAGQFQTTRLIDFLAACLGSTNTKKFREWIAAGGGPPRPADRNDQQAELKLIEEWLGWWDNLEVYGTITHATDQANPDRVFARFAGPMAVGSLPGQKDDEYQAHGRGKLRAIIVASEAEPPAEPVGTGPAVRFTQDGKQVSGDGSPELPF